MTAPPRPTTPDGRYFVVRGRLWRRANPGLFGSEREAPVFRLIAAWEGVRSARQASDAIALAKARAAVKTAKIALGERGPVWWTDRSPDLNCHMARATPYADGSASPAPEDSA